MAAIKGMFSSMQTSATKVSKPNAMPEIVLFATETLDKSRTDFPVNKPNR